MAENRARNHLLHDLDDGEDVHHTHDFPDLEHTGVVILGAGLAGIALLAGLEKVGIPAIILEKSTELRQTGSAISLWPNCFNAMHQLGVGGPKFRQQFIQNKEFQALNTAGKVVRRFDMTASLGAPGAGIREQRSVNRKVLQAELASVCNPKSFYFGCSVESVEDTETGALVTLRNGQQLRAKVVVGAEGANSPTARYLGLPAPTYCGYVGIRGLAPVSAGLKRGALLPGGHFRLVQGRGCRFGMIQITEDYCYFFVTPNAPEDSHLTTPEQIREEARAAVKGWKFPAIDIIEACKPEDLQRSRIFHRWMPAGKAFGRGSVTLMGDAQHVSSPNLGQGGCAAVEDAVELTRFLRLGVGGEVGSAGPAFKAASKATIAKALREYEVHRTKRTTAIVQKSFWTGYIGQVSSTPAVWLRDLYVGNLLSGKGMFDHTAYDCGTL